MVKVLVDNGADCRSPHASGDFFYEHRALYFGGSCLGFAACMDQKETVKYLLSNPNCQADVNQRDLGSLSSKTFHTSMALDNTVLHCLVLHDRKSMYEYLVSEHEANAWATNANGDTPLLLACRRSLDMAEVALDSSRQLVWSYASVSCVRYPLYELEGDGYGNTLASLGRRSMTERSLLGSAREASSVAAGKGKGKTTSTVISVVSRERVAQLLYSDVLWKLINDKWVAFGRRRFFWFALVSMLAIVLLTLSLCQPGEDPNADECNGILVFFFVPIRVTMTTKTAEGVFHASLAFDVYLILRLLFCMYSLDMHLDANAVLRQTAGLLSYTLPWVGYGVRTIDDGLYRAVLGIAAFWGWIHFMKVSFSFNQNLGPMVLTVEEMLKSDATTFVAIYFAYLHAFGAAMLGMFTSIAGEVPDVPAGYDIYYRLLRYTLNADLPDQSDRLVVPSTGEDYDFHSNLTDTGTWRTWAMLQGYFWFEFMWAIVSSVVLLNLLIAMMSNRYNLIMDSAEAEWRLQFLDLVMLQEATPWCFVPLPNAMPWATMPHRRPAHHIRGKLAVIDSNEQRREIDCWFLMMNLNNNANKQAAEGTGDDQIFGGGGGGGGHGEARRQAERMEAREAQTQQTEMLLQVSQRLEKMEAKLETTHQVTRAHHDHFRRHTGDDERISLGYKATDALTAVVSHLSSHGDSPSEEHGGGGSMGGGRKVKPEWLELLDHVSTPTDVASVARQAKRASDAVKKRCLKKAKDAAGGDGAAASSIQGQGSSKKAERDEEREEESGSREADGRRSQRAAPPPASEERAKRRAQARAAQITNENGNWPAGPPQIRSSNDISISTATQMILEGAARRWGGDELSV